MSPQSSAVLDAPSQSLPCPIALRHLDLVSARTNPAAYKAIAGPVLSEVSAHLANPSGAYRITQVEEPFAVPGLEFVDGVVSFAAPPIGELGAFAPRLHRVYRTTTVEDALSGLPRDDRELDLLYFQSGDTLIELTGFLDDSGEPLLSEDERTIVLRTIDALSDLFDQQP